jgi:hypothetical protein
MPKESFVQKQEECKGRKLYKERISVPLCSSATGEKLKLLVVGNAVQPCIFKEQHVDTNHLLLHGASVKRPGLPQVLKEWLTDLNSTMKK